MEKDYIMNRDVVIVSVCGVHGRLSSRRVLMFGRGLDSSGSGATQRPEAAACRLAPEESTARAQLKDG